MKRDPKIVIDEMTSAIDCLHKALDGYDFKSFTQNWTMRLAAQRAIEIISEASRHLPQEMIILEPDINWRKVRDMGNFLRHEYHHIQDEIIWDVSINRLDDLRIALTRMLSRL